MSYKLDEKFLAGQPEFANLREGFGAGLVATAKTNDKVVALAADLTESVGFEPFAKTFPERFVQVGIAEQNLVTVASGMAHVGYIPFAASYAAFNPGRNYEQIRTTIAINNQPVKIVGTHAGVNVGPDGATHQMLEDIAMMRVLPRMVVIAPGDAREASRVAEVISRDSRPTYVRLPREKSLTFSAENSEFEIGKAYVLREGTDITLLGTGTMTAQNLLAAELLAKENISAEVVHCPTIKPLDSETILQSVAKTRAVITIEEHEIAGGFGSAVAELILDRHSESILESDKELNKILKQVQDDKMIKFSRIGLRDEFGQSGTATELLEYYGLTAENIVRVVKECLE